MRQRNRGRWASLLTSAAFALLSLGLAAGEFMTAQDINWL
jgi:hypothetical protein